MLRFLYLCLFLTIANYVVADDDSSDSDSDSSGSKSSSSESSEEPANVILGDDHQAARSAIYGGDYVNVKDVKYIAQLLRDDMQVCGGSIISPTHILTAAHCIHRPIRVKTYSVIVGSSFNGRGGKEIKVKSIDVHEDYDMDTSDNDIALITLNSAIKFDSTKDAIPIINRKAATGDKVTIAGFGLEGAETKASPVLKKAVLDVKDKEECKAYYLLLLEAELTDNQFCAGEGFPDTCQGDSGGPVVTDGALAGIVSFGFQCSETSVPGVYTEVYNYRAWIEQHSGLKL